MCNYREKQLQIADTDLAISELLEEIWKAKIPVVDARESFADSNSVGIIFPSSHEAGEFLSIISRYDDGSKGTLSYRILEPKANKPWKVGVGVRAEDETLVENGIVIEILALFPRSDYNEVLRRIQHYNSNP